MVLRGKPRGRVGRRQPNPYPTAGLIQSGFFYLSKRQRSMLQTPDAHKIPWKSLIEAFASFEPDDEWKHFPPNAFEAALMTSAKPFVEAFLKAKFPHESATRSEHLRSLYAFLLERRYREKLNLLYFAFDVFDETSQLPEDVIARTPFPHEDGVPAFRYALQAVSC